MVKIQGWIRSSSRRWINSEKRIILKINKFSKNYYVINALYIQDVLRRVGVATNEKEAKTIAMKYMETKSKNKSWRYE